MSWSLPVCQTHSHPVLLNPDNILGSVAACSFPQWGRLAASRDGGADTGTEGVGGGRDPCHEPRGLSRRSENIQAPARVCHGRLCTSPKGLSRHSENIQAIAGEWLSWVVTNLEGYST